MNKLKSFKLGLFNAGSLCNVRKHDELIVAALRHDAGILAINETWLRAGGEIQAPSLPGYKLKHVPRNIGTRRSGGGVGLYVKSSVNARTCAHPVVEDVEQMWVRIKLNGLRFIVGTAYRPPWLNAEVFLSALSDSLASFCNYDHIIICGDFNIDLLDRNDSKAEHLEHFLECHNLKNHISLPTHFTNHSATLIDLICTDANVLRSEIDHVPELGGHAMVFVELNLKIPIPAPRTVFFRSLKKIDLKQFNWDLLSVDWECILVQDSIEDKVRLFNNFLIELFDVHAPVRKHVFKESPKPWFTENVRYMIDLRNRAHKTYTKTKSDRDKNKYKTLKSLVTSSLFYEKKAYFEHHVNKNLNNAKLLWKNIKQNIVPSFKNTSDLPYNFKDPNAINNHFLNVPGRNFTDLSTLTYFEHHLYGKSTFTLSTVDEGVVAKLLLRTKSNAQGYDGITFDMILMTLPRTLAVITDIINTSIRTSKVPSIWKIAVVRPIPKVTDPVDFKDLRPISILPYLSKILEKVVYDQISAFLEINEILPEMQSGFRKKRSTSTALQDVMDEILTAQDAGLGTILVLLDFTRAFDCISVPLLLSKLHFYGFDCATIRWFDSYFEYRKQLVKIDQTGEDCLLSSEGNLTRGVPQGSILAPLLFILYSSDIVRIIKHCKFHLYADDLQVYFSFHPCDLDTAVDMINADLKRIFEWSSINSLVLNPSKSKYMVLGSRNQINKIASLEPQLIVNDIEVHRVVEARNLGLLMDGSLHFEKYVVETTRNCFFRLKVLYNMRDFLSVPLRLRLCEALVLSKLNYCLTAIGPCLLARSWRLLQRVQNACARFCFRIPPRSHVTPFINNASMLKMSKRHDFLFACLLFDGIKTQTPSYLYKNLKRSRPSSAAFLSVPCHRTAAFRGSFRYRTLRTPPGPDLSFHLCKHCRVTSRTWWCWRRPSSR